MSHTKFALTLGLLLGAQACQMDVGGGAGGSQPSNSGGSTTSTSTSQNSNTPQSPIDVQGARLLGRVNPTTQQLSWAGTGIAFKFKGTQAAIKFSQVTGSNSVALVVDGGTPTITNSVSAQAPISTAKVAQGLHEVTLIKRSEASFGSLTFGSVTTDGTLETISTLGRRIEFIGDSITVGYGAAGTSPCDNSAQLEDAPNTYGALTAKALEADFSLVAWSGKGLTRNAASLSGDATPLMPDLWTRYSALDTSGSYTFPSANTPDAVVINLGTNDFAYMAYDASGQSSKVRDPLVAATFEAAYVAFIKQIREKYPEATLFLTSSPMLSDTYPSAAEQQHTNQLASLNAVVKTLSDSKIQVVDFPTQQVGSGINGCDSHPSLAEHKAMASVLAPAIKTALGW